MNPSGSNSETSMAARPHVLLADSTRWPEAARLAIGLSSAGIDVSAVCPSRGHPLRKTRCVRRMLPYSGVRPLDSLVAAINATKPRIIIPCDDRAVQHLHELHARAGCCQESGRHMAALIERSIGSPESYPIVSTRYHILKVAREEGLRVADTELINTVDDLKSWRPRHAFPWVLKADGTWAGRGVRLASSLAEAERLFLELKAMTGAAQAIKWAVVDHDSFWLRPWWNRWRPAVVVQSNVDGRPANCAVVCAEGRVLAGIAVEVLASKEPTAPAAVVRVVDNTEMMLCAERVARRLSLSGFFGLDFMIENGSGATYLIEMNPRCTPLCHLRLGKGRDMVGALAAQLSGQPLRENAPITEKDLIAYYPAALKCKSDLLHSSFHDVPSDEPELAEELLRPWSKRNMMTRLYVALASFVRATSLE
jgi:ATP-grasp domain